MSIKSEYEYNEDNFVEENENLKELTVTITLCEYRNLIEDRAYSDKAIGELQDEVEKLKKQNEAFVNLILKMSPDIAKPLKEQIESVFALLYNTAETIQTYNEEGQDQ